MIYQTMGILYEIKKKHLIERELNPSHIFFIINNNNDVVVMPFTLN